MKSEEIVVNRRQRGAVNLPLIGAVGAIAVLLIAGLLYWFVLRDTSAESVDSEAAAVAREQAAQEASADSTDSNDSAYSGQGDTVGDAAGLDGTWRVDTSIGSFGDACLESVCDATFVGFRINEELSGIGAKTVVGRTPGVSGSMEISGSQILSVDIVADMTKLITDSGPRTEAIRTERGGLETSAFPDARFVLTQPIDLGEVPAEGISVQAQATGDLTVHGVTRPVVIPLSAEMQGGLISVIGNLEGLLLSDFEIPTPTAVVVLSVEDNATMEVQLWMSR